MTTQPGAAKVLTERERFEAVMEGEPHNWHRMLWTYEDGQYREQTARMAWFAWQARATLPESPAPIPAAAGGDVPVAPEGWRMVPVEPNDKMMLMGGFSFAGKVPNEQVFPEVRRLWAVMLRNAPPAPVAWSPIETAPKDGTRIMLAVFRPGMADPTEHYLLATWDGEHSHPFVPNEWTHWMALKPLIEGGRP